MASRTVFSLRAVLSSWRCYGTSSHNKTAPHYQSFKKGVASVRVKIMEELKQEERILTEDLNSEAAQEARREEALAVEENEKELKRMAEKR